jgi:hypothetical protein
MHEVRASSLLGSKAVQQHPIMLVVSRNQVVEHWNPQSDHHADNAAVQASGIEKSVVGKTTFDREYPTTVRTVGTQRAFCNSPVHEQWLLHVAVLVGRCSPALITII